jgi:hypothetical protein
MEHQTKAGSRQITEERPSLLALINQNEMRRALKHVIETDEATRRLITAKFMPQYDNPLLEAGFPKDSFGYKMAEIVLAAVNYAIFERA